MIHHLLLQNSPSHDSSPHALVEHTSHQRLLMLLWSVCLLLGSAFVLPILHEFDDRGYWTRKLIHVCKVTLIMCIAWGFLLWGQWEFYENLFEGDVMFGHLLFACIATLVCVLVLYMLAALQLHHKNTRATRAICITGISLAAAWSWEHCFNQAFNILGDRYNIGYGGCVPKGVLAIIIPLAILPAYLFHIKPRVIADEEELEQDFHFAGQAGHHDAEKAHSNEAA